MMARNLVWLPEDISDNAGELECCESFLFASPLWTVSSSSRLCQNYKSEDCLKKRASQLRSAHSFSGVLISPIE
eukprot:scaffold19455_cov18-Tisochrysis_lutea.AAC.1